LILDNYFKLEENKTSLKREALAGATTFATIAYIIDLPFRGPLRAAIQCAGTSLRTSKHPA